MRKTDYLVSTALAAILISLPAFGQAPAPQAEGADEATIVVTGTRITASGFSAPTPTTMLSADDLQKNAEPNVFTTITQLPSLQGSTGTATNTNSTSSGLQGLSSFSLRGLGTIRTLTLLDGQRVVGANVTGVPDVSEFPQLLIKRVDVVTGGASASYGSDAVGGVVNFITDKRFEGFKAQAQGGVTTYGDNGQYTLGAAAGDSYLGGRLHLEGSVEYDHEDGVPAGGYGENAPNGRKWFHAATLLNTGVTNNGKPQYVYENHAQAYQYALNGLINSGPLQGTAFDAAGNPFPFQYGSNGVPAKNGKVTGCYVGFCVGGDTSGDVGIGSTLQSSIRRLDGYGRIGYSLDDNNEVYASLNLAQVKTANQPNPGSAKTNLTIPCNDPFVPGSIQTACTNAGITSFSYGLTNDFLPNILVEPTRTQDRIVLGAEGKVTLAGTDWHYDAYYERGENLTDLKVSNMPISNITGTSRYYLATQATMLNGQIVCANAAARANGCVPINVFGNNPPSAAALAYIEPANGPFQHTRQTERAASLAIDGSPFSLWAGPVSVAFGAEHRSEWYRVNADPYGNGVSGDSPYSAAYPADPTIDPKGANWYAGNYHDGSGRYDVTEAFVETNVPLLDSTVAGKVNLNLAGRWTDYSTSGTIYAWKIGGTWQTPYEPLKFRSVMSRDVRAPNLSELFAAPVSVTTPGFTNPFNNTSLTVIQNTIGNTALKPEKALNTELGVVFDHPDFLPGFSASVDYYRIQVNDIISSLTAQQEVNFCFGGIQAYCGAFNLTGASPYVNVQSFNLASIYTNGIDVEASYQQNLAKFGLPGSLTLRGLATNIRNFIQDPGISGTVPVQMAGNNTNNTPTWKVYASQSWEVDKIGVDLIERWFSDGNFGNQYVVCQTNCPVSTVNAPTINYNKMSGALYLDVGARYYITDKLTAFIKVDNLLDRDPTPSPQTNTGIDINPALYDTIGRMYRAGIRYNF